VSGAVPGSEKRRVPWSTVACFADH
jgi:hypothetical protein